MLRRFMDNIDYKYLVPAFLTACMMAIGQLMFSLGARTLNTQTFGLFLSSTFSSAWLTGAIALYAVTILTWIYALKHLPLSVAYPITACAYIITPVLASIFLGEPLPAKLLVGSGLILAGLAVIYL